MSETATKCDGCGMESEQTAIFECVPYALGSQTRVLCPACAAGKDGRIHKIFFASLAGLSAVALVLTVAFPSISLGAWLLNIALLVFLECLCTVAHELGHVLAGRWVGFRIFMIEIGLGRVISEFQFGGLRWQFRTVLFGGCVHGAPRDTVCYQLKDALFTLGGPFANLVLLGVAIWALPLDSAIEASPFAGFAPAAVLAICNAATLLYSLWPRRGRSQYGEIPNDALLLWQTLRLTASEIEQLPAHRHFLEGQECERQGHHAEAEQWVEEGLRLYPDNYSLQWLQASTLTLSKRYAEARRAYVRLLGRYAKVEELRFTLFNNIAYVDALTGNAKLLEEADVCSRLALEKYPRNVYFRGTRGTVLLAMGKRAEGLELLHRVLKEHPERQEKALNACIIALAETRLGNLKESRSFFALARRLDPHCFLLEHEREASLTTHPTS